MTTYHVLPAEKERAERLTQEIRDATDHVWELLYQAWTTKAWAALGYKNWHSYTAAEFDIKRSRAYEIIQHQGVVRKLREAETSNVKHSVTTEYSTNYVSQSEGRRLVAQQREPERVEVKRIPPVTRVQVARVESGEGNDWFYEEPTACAHEYVCRHCGELLA